MNVAKTHLCTPEERRTVLRSIEDALKTDPRIAGVVLVGSGAVGFQDEFSDIDLSVVVRRMQDIEPVFREWGTRSAGRCPWLATSKRGTHRTICSGASCWKATWRSIWDSFASIIW